MPNVTRINGITRDGKQFRFSSAEQFERCPVCKQRVKVAGPINKMWVIQPHAPVVITKVNELCAGVNTNIPVLP